MNHVRGYLPENEDLGAFLLQKGIKMLR